MTATPKIRVLCFVLTSSVILNLLCAWVTAVSCLCGFTSGLSGFSALTVVYPGALIISWLCLAVFVGANYYPKSYVLIPGAVVEGLATGLMWTAQGVYVTTCAFEYSQVGHVADVVVANNSKAMLTASVQKEIIS